MNKKKLGYSLLTGLGIFALIALVLSDPITQNEDYHQFSDRLTVLGIANFWNVVSNLPFLIIGALGIAQLKKIQQCQTQFLAFFIGIALVAFGSGFYHYHPVSDTLVWDRLPMTIAFTSLISIMISEFMNQRLGKLALLPLLFLGLASIVYWVVFDDLRFYAFVQFYPILGIPIVLLLFKKDGVPTKGYWQLLLAYMIAKLFETFDAEIHEVIGHVSGHSLKHIAAAVGVYALLKSYLK